MNPTDLLLWSCAIALSLIIAGIATAFTTFLVRWALATKFNAPIDPKTKGETTK